MSERERERRRVGVRELRQNLSVYLREVKAGESLDVTERGSVVARLDPPPPPDESVLERLERKGKVARATRSLADLPAPVRVEGAGSTPASDVLRRMRDEERW
jgi:antitoxin (DNA-binding transcriptional repressor) of toxin-antitoxin stability system